MFDPKSYYQDRSVAGLYDVTRFQTVRGRLFRTLRARLLEELNQEVPMGKHVLDIACGTGLITEWHAAKGRSVISGDISHEMLAVAREKFKPEQQVKVVRLDAQFLPFSDKSFDSVTCFRFLNLVNPEIRKVIHQEIARVSRRYALLTYAYDSKYQRLRSVLKQILGFSTEGGSPATPEALERELVAAGMKIIRRMTLNPVLSSELIVLAEITTRETAIG